MPKLRILFWILSIGVMFFGSFSVRAGDWPTFGHDPQRSGWASEETKLSTKNVSALQLEWKIKLPDDPKSEAALTAPVVVTTTTPSGSASTVYVAGSSDGVFAVDVKTGKLLWNVKLPSHVLPKHPGIWVCPNNLNATPTIDRQRGLLYVIGSSGTFFGLDLNTGITKVGPLQFVPPFSKNWSLNLWGDTIFTSISQGCGGARSGIYSIDVHQPDIPSVRDLLVSKKPGAGIWGRGATVIGDDGRIYATTGDGIFDPAGNNYGSSVIAATVPDLQIVDYYSPLNYREITKYDLDISSASPVWFPYRDYGLIAAGGKEGVIYLLDAKSLGMRDHQTPLASLKLANDELAFEQKGIWGAISSSRDEEGDVWVYVPIWGPTSTKAPTFPIRNGDAAHGCVMAFKVATDAASGKPELVPVWTSADLDVPDPVAIANDVVFALSTGENTLQTYGARVEFTGQKLLSDAQRGENTHHAVLYALDAKTGKVLYESGSMIEDWVHFSGLAVADGRVFAVDHSSSLYCFGLKEQK